MIRLGAGDTRPRGAAVTKLGSAPLAWDEEKFAEDRDLHFRLRYSGRVKHRFTIVRIT